MICWVAKGRVNKIIPNTKKLKVIFTSWHYRVDAQTQRRQPTPEPFFALPTRGHFSVGALLSWNLFCKHASFHKSYVNA